MVIVRVVIPHCLGIDERSLKIWDLSTQCQLVFGWNPQRNLTVVIIDQREIEKRVGEGLRG